MKFWINCLSKNHVLAGVEGGFTQVGSGKADPMRRLAPGDIVVLYSEGTLFRGGQRLQSFTAIGRVAAGDPFQVQVSPGVIAWRRRIEYLDAEEASILPLVPSLAFIPDKAQWAASLRTGLFSIGEADGAAIAAAMKAVLS